MATTIKTLIPRKQAEASQTAQYTANNVRAVIDTFTATNTNTVNVQFSINLVASSGTAGDDNLVLKKRTIPPGDTYLCPEMVGQVIENGGFISTLASVSSSITISAAGREIS